MSFVTTKQQRLIEDAVSNHVKYYDKTINQYLKLRQDLFKLTNDIIQSQQQPLENDEQQESNNSINIKLQLNELKFNLDRMYQLYKSHLIELTNFLIIHKQQQQQQQQKGSIIIDDVNNQYESLTIKQNKLKDEINNITKIQKPLLEKLRNLVYNFNSNLDPLKVKQYTANTGGTKEPIDYETSTKIDLSSLKFTKEQLVTLFNDITDSLNVEESLKNNTRLFEYQPEDDDSMIYRLNKSSLHEISTQSTIDEYDELIATTINQINSLNQEGFELKQNWNKMASKIEIISQIIINEQSPPPSHDLEEDQQVDIEMEG